MKRLALSIIVILALALSIVPQMSAQMSSTGQPRFGSLENYGIEHINRANHNVNLSIPIYSAPGRGVALNVILAYDSNIWSRGGAWTPSPGFGWNRAKPAGAVTFTKKRIGCGRNVFYYIYYDYKFTEPNGTVHPFDLFIVPEFGAEVWCAQEPTTVFTGYATDQSGYLLDANDFEYPTAYAPTGASVENNGSMMDTNGNYLSNAYVDQTTTAMVDTRGNQAVKTTVYPAVGSTQDTAYAYLTPSGTYVSYTLRSELQHIKTKFDCSGVIEYDSGSQPFYLPTRLTLPNGLIYQFAYEPTPGYPTYTTGRISKVTLPSGATYSYTYGPMVCTTAVPAALTKTVNDGTNTYSWGFNGSEVLYPQMSGDPGPNKITFSFDGLQEIGRTYYQATGQSTWTPVASTSTSWNGITPAVTTTTMGNKSAHTDTTFDDYGNIKSVAEYDFGASTPTRSTNYEYLSGAAYVDSNVVDRQLKITVLEGTTKRSVTEFRYDEGNLLDCDKTAPGHFPNFNCSFTVRGNVTSVRRYTNPEAGSADIIQSLTYDIFGNVRSVSLNDVVQNTSSFSSATYFNAPDSVTVGSGTGALTTNYSYNLFTGQVTNVTDPNGAQTGYTYDSQLRVTQVLPPSNAPSTYSYDDGSTATNPHVSVTSPIDAGNTISVTTWFDKLGNAFQTDGPTSSVQKQFDALGRAYKVSNPYTTSPQYWTTTSYDVLGRVVQVKLPDNNMASSAYTDNTVIITDPTGKQRKQEFDSAGRITHVYEPDVNNSNALTVNSDYTYNALDSLVGVTQGVQARTFTYDGLNRLLSVSTPEAGNLQYAYKTTGQTPTYCSQEPSNVCSRTDARGVVTTYTYDSLNRPYQISYNASGVQPPNSVPATPTVTYGYGTSVANHNNGRLISMTDGTGSETYTYDLVGQALTVAKLVTGTPNQTYTTQYAYNDAGQVKKITYPSGMAINQNVDTSTGMLASITEGPQGTPTKTYLSGLSYNPAGQVTGYTMGASIPIASSMGYSAQRLQLGSLAYTQSGNTIMSLSYGYSQNNGNNGQITAINDLVKTGRNATYNYDALSRLTAFSTLGSFTENGNNYGAESMSWTYDRYGNRLTQARNGYTTQALTPSSSTNRIGSAYDASGNMTSDGTYGMTWDAEGRMVQFAADVFYAYDGNSLRVSKSHNGTTVFIRAGAQTIAEYSAGAAPTSPSREYIYSGSQLLASKANGNYKWYVRDHLSPRLVYDDYAATLLSYGHLPFGETWYGETNEKWRFTSYERDSDTSQDYAVFRQYTEGFGRFSSPDPVVGNRMNPQSWNRYTYSLNDPINLLDPFGLSFCTWSDHVNGDSYDFHPDSRAECEGNGGYYTDTDTSIEVNGGDSVEVAYDWNPFTRSWIPEVNIEAPNNPPSKATIPSPTQKGSCGSSLATFGVGVVGTVLTAGAVVAAVYVGPEEFVGFEGLLTLTHLAPVLAPGPTIMALTAPGVIKNCFR